MPQPRDVPIRPARRGRNTAARALTEALESRRLLCGSPVSAAVSPSAASASLAAAGISPPDALLLHSLPGAPAAIYLDFDGFGTYGPYDTDGDPAAFGAAEQAEIAGAWRQVAAYFSMLDVDVTTEPPSVPFSYSLISNGVTSGTNLGNFPSLLPTNFNTPSQATGRASALAHEIGHSLGLEHQSVYDRQGVKTAEYSSGYDLLHGPIMGIDYAQDVHKWFIGHPSSSPLLLQDDLAVMAATLRPYTGGDGFRPDDLPDDLAHANPVAAGAGTRSASGIIERLSDRDAFAFTVAGGRVAIDLVPPAPSMLDAKLEVYSADGTLIAAADGPENDQHLVFPRLAAGTYYAVVSGHGDYADVGPYDLDIAETEAAEVPPPDSGLPAPAGLTVAVGQGLGMDLRWDAVPGATWYAIDRSDDGLTWASAGTTGGADPTTFADAALAGGHRYFYRVSAAGDSGTSAPTAPASAVTRPAAVSGLSFTNWRSERFVLNWNDVSGETGYRVERLLDNGTGSHPWVLMANLDANVPSFVDRMIAPNTRYRYRVTATSPRGDSAPAEVIAAPPLVSVNNLQVTARLPTRVDLGWTAIWGVASYSVERSDDGVTYAAVGSTATESFSDDTVEPVNKYYYRVRGTNDVGETAFSATVLTATPPLDRLPAGWTVADVGGASYGAAGTYAPGAAGFGPAPDTLSVIGGGRGTADSVSVNSMSDSFRFVYRRMTGNSIVTARVASLAGTPGRYSAAGVMLRNGENPSAAFVFAGLDSNGVAGTQSRLRDGTRASWFDPVATDFAVAWFRLVRTGSIVKAWVSAGGDVWQQAGTFTFPTPTTLLVGLVASAGGDDLLTETTFDNVNIGVNRAPLFIEAPAASPAIVEGDQTQLTVLASDEGGEEKLVYNWSLASGPAGAPLPSFSDNDTNSAKWSTATFYQAGEYVLRVRVTNAPQFSATANVPVTVVPMLTRIAVAPLGVPVQAGTDFPFTATPLDQFDDPYAGAAGGAAPEVTWAASYGRIGAGGSYNSGAYSGWDSVTASAGFLSTPVDFFVYDDSGPALLSVVSRKNHARRGAFDLPLALYGLAAAVEPRRGGPTTLRFTFSKAVVADDRSLGDDNFLISGAAYRSSRVSGSVLTLELADAVDGGTVTVWLTGLTGTDGGMIQGQRSVDVRALYGDVDRDGTVAAADLLSVRRRVMRVAGASDFLCDVDLNGVIAAADLVAVRRRMIAGLPL